MNFYIMYISTWNFAHTDSFKPMCLCTLINQEQGQPKLSDSVNDILDVRVMDQCEIGHV